MKRIIIFLLSLIFSFLTGCESEDNLLTESSIISLPTIHTEQTANGYRNPALAVSSDTSSKASDSSSYSTESKLITNASVYIGSKNSKVFHIADCSSAKRIKEQNIIIFEDFEEASTKGYSPCSYCLVEK